MSRSHSNPARVWLNFIRGTRAARIQRKETFLKWRAPPDNKGETCQYLLSHISKTEQNSVAAFLSLTRLLDNPFCICLRYGVHICSISVFLVQVSSAFMEGL